MLVSAFMTDLQFAQAGPGLRETVFVMAISSEEIQ